MHRDERTDVEIPGDPLIATTVLGQYEVLRRIGGGGYGTVYLAEQLGLARKAVLKVLRTHTDEDAHVVLRRFEREAKALAALDHPHFVRLYNFGRLDDGRPFLAMEYGGETNVHAEVKKLKRLQPERALIVAEQVCEALDEAHRRGIIHRDLKPHNVILGRRDGHDWVKVCDLGIAKIMDGSGPDETGRKLTGAGIVVGTPMYFSPEQCSGGALDGRSDLYSLGVVLYEMLSGKLPIHGSTMVDYVRAHVVDAPQPLARHVALPPAVESVVMKALRKKPEERYQTALEMRDALRAARATLDEPRVEVHPAAKHRGRRAVLALLVVLVVGAAAAGVWAALRPDARGALVIRVAPESAELLLDGRRIRAGTYQVRPGRHRVVARAEGYEEQSKVLRVASDQSLDVEMTLVRESQ